MENWQDVLISRAKSEISRLRKKLEDRQNDMRIISDSFQMMGQRLEAFIRLGDAISRAEREDELLEQFLCVVAGAMKVEAGTIILIDEKTGRLAHRRDLVGGRTIMPEKSQTFDGDSGIAGWVSKTGNFYIANEVAKEPRFKGGVDIVRGCSPSRILCVPLRIGRRTIGAVEVMNPLNGEPFTESDATMLVALANQIAMVIENARLFKQSEKKIRELSTLIEVSSIINSTRDLDVLLDLVMEQSRIVMNAEASSLMLIDEKTNELVFKIAHGEKGEAVKEIRLKMGEGIAGWVAQTGEPLLVPDVDKDSRFYKGADEKTKFKTKSILCVPLRSREKVIGVVEVLNKLESAGGPAFDDEDVTLFMALAHQSAIAIENAILQKESLEKELIEQELSVARNIQMSLLPQEYPDFPGVELHAKSIPARQVGGDYYDFVRIDDTKLGLTIADVSGKSISAAFLMTLLRTLFHTYIETMFTASEVMTAINDRLCRDIESSKFITMFYAVFDRENMNLTFVDAGHTKPILFHRATGEHRFLNGTGMVLGIMEGGEYEAQTVKVDRGDTIVFYTDGISEAMNPIGVLFTEQRLVDTIKRHAELGAEGLANKIYEEIKEFAGEAPQHDDATLIVLKIKE
ncbi:MAG: SpoIIE family protein phosphatase [bacterium]